MFSINVHNGDLYNIEEPVESPGAEILLDLPGFLSATKNFGLLNRLGLGKYNIAAETAYIAALANRDRGAFNGNIVSLVGRSLLVESLCPAPVFAQQQFDTLEFSGFGAQEFHKMEGTRGMAIIYPDEPIRVPNMRNFYDIQRGMSNLTKVEGGKIVHKHRDYCPEGAYPLEHAVEKFALSLEAFHASQMNGNTILTPLPMYLGRYKGISKDGEYPYFLVNRVPYRGKRTGIIDNEMEPEAMLGQISASMPRIARGLKHLHGKLRVEHGSMVPSNYFTPEDETAPPYLADWATATGIRPRSPDHIAQRAIDLGKPFEDYWNGARVIRPKLLDNKIMLATLVNQQLGTLLSNYLGKKVAVAISPKNEIFMLQALVGSGVEYVQRELAHYLPRIDQIPPTGKEYNPERAEKLKKQLLSYIAKALV